MEEKRKKLIIGVGIDGIIRNTHAAFDRVYRKVFIKNDSLVQMNERFEYANYVAAMSEAGVSILTFDNWQYGRHLK